MLEAFVRDELNRTAPRYTYIIYVHVCMCMLYTVNKDLLHNHCVCVCLSIGPWQYLIQSEWLLPTSHPVRYTNYCTMVCDAQTLILVYLYILRVHAHIHVYVCVWWCVFIQAIDLEVPDFPKDPQRGSHNIPLGPLVYIERSDFLEGGQKGFRRLTPDQPVGLKYMSSAISVQHVVKVGYGTVCD